jgi:hypothetical protein
LIIVSYDLLPVLFTNIKPPKQCQIFSVHKFYSYLQRTEFSKSPSQEAPGKTIMNHTFSLAPFLRSSSERESRKIKTKKNVFRAQTLKGLSSIQVGI